MEDRMKDDCDCAVCAAAAPPMATAASAGSAAASAAKAGPPRSASAALGVAGAFTLRRELPFLIGAAAAFGLGLAMKAGFPRSLAGFEAGPAVLFIASYLLAGRDVLMGAMRNIVRGRVLDELFLMSIATIGAIAIGRFEEAVEVMALYKVGEAIQASASRKSRASVRDLLVLKPTTVRLRRDRSWVLVDPDFAAAGDEFMVMPGERIALDGEVVEGECFVDTSALTGESMPRRIEPGVEVLAGCVALDGSFKAVASRPAKESAAARIALLVEEASRSKAKSARMITRFSRVYTPIVVAAAALLAFAPPLLMPGQSFSAWIYRALVLLVISCPCALVISVPLGYFCGMGAMARRGILVKGAEVLDVLARARSVVFDKTGTLTAGSFTLKQVSARPGFGEDELLTLAAAAESRSRHPIAASIRAEATARGLSVGAEDEASAISERPGAGVVALVGGRRVVAGNDRLLHLEAIPHECRDSLGTTVSVAVDGLLAGSILVEDQAKPDAARAIGELAALGCARFVMLTGDASASALPVAARLGISEVATSLLPQGKLDYLERVVAETTALGGSTVFVGDGLNDAPALARADVGAAMGAGADAAIERADLVLMTDEPSRLGEAVTRARRTRRVVVEGIVFILAVKAAFLALGAFGAVQMWEAVFADVGVAILAVANATRALGGVPPLGRRGRDGPAQASLNRELRAAIVFSQPDASRRARDAATALSSSGKDRAKRRSAASPRRSPSRPRRAPMARAAGLRASASSASIEVLILAAKPGISLRAAARARSPSAARPAQCSARAGAEGASRASTAESR